MDTLSNFPAITTQRLHIRALCEADAHSVQDMTNHTSITDCVHFLPTPFDHAAALALIKNQNEGRDLFLGAWLNSSPTLVAILGTHLRGENEIEIGYWVHPEFHRQGIAKEAAGALMAALQKHFPTRHLIAECRPGNTASWALLEKLGFTPTHQDGLRPGRKKLILGKSL